MNAERTLTTARLKRSRTTDARWRGNRFSRRAATMHRPESGPVWGQHGFVHLSGGGGCGSG